MKRCPSCNIKVNTDRKTCPLCYDILIDVDNVKLEEPIYPLYSLKKNKKNLFIKTIIFVCLLTSIVTLFINLITRKEGESLWFPYIAASMLYIFILIRNCILSKYNTAFRIVVQMISLSVLMYIIDYFSGYTGWSINYVIPLLSVVSSFTIVIVLLARKVKYSEYIFCLISSIILGTIPFILWVFKLVEVLWPSLFAVCFSFMVFLGIIIFADKLTKEEFKKRFHI